MSLSEEVYKLVKKILAGKVATYGQIARELGRPNSSRAIGRILSKNQNSFLDKNKKNRIPCHRVVMSDGFLGGYNGGTQNKVRLLTKEGIIIKNNKIDLDKYIYKY